MPHSANNRNQPFIRPSHRPPRVWLHLLVFLPIISNLIRPSSGLAAVAPQQATLSVQRNAISLNFPTSLTFQLEATVSEPVAEVFLNYGANRRGCLAGFSRQSIDLSGGAQISAEWEWDFVQSGSLPPGAQIWWEWELILSNGDSLPVARQEFTLEDPRFTWQDLSKDRISVFWVQGNAAFGAQIAALAQHSLDRLEENLGISSQEPIRLTIYPSTDDLKGAFLYLSDWVGGLALPEFNNLIIAIPSDALTWAEEVIPHEIAHLVTGMRTANCLGVSLPTWLSEGLSVAAEGEQSQADRDLLLEKLAADDLPPLVALASGFSAHAGEAQLSYTQSGAIVFYLIDTYGPEKLDQLLTVIQSGKNANPALIEVYGLDTAGIDQAWRASLGYGEAPIQSASTPTQPPTQVPTLALYTAAVAISPTPSATIPATKTPTHAALPPTSTPTAPPSPSPTPSSPASPLRCLSGAMLNILAPLGLILIVAIRRRAGCF